MISCLPVVTYEHPVRYHWPIKSNVVLICLRLLSVEDFLLDFQTRDNVAACILYTPSFRFSEPRNRVQSTDNIYMHHKTTMKICLYQLLFVVSLFVVVVQSTDVSEEAAVVVTSTTRKPYLRSLWDTWTANSSPSTNVGTTNANNAQEQSVSRCSLCHDGSYPKNPNHGVST